MNYNLRQMSIVSLSPPCDCAASKDDPSLARSSLEILSTPISSSLGLLEFFCDGLLVSALGCSAISGVLCRPVMSVWMASERKLKLVPLLLRNR